MKIKAEEVDGTLMLKQTMLDGANNRLVDLENELQGMHIEHDAYKKKAKRILQVRIIE